LRGEEWELIQVVANGTARRACCGFAKSDGSIVPLGGKTGTGDNRIKIFTSGGRLVDSRVANRTAVFAFIIGDRFLGTVIVLSLETPPGITNSPVRSRYRSLRTWNRR